jgi:polysaccharide pyruvyl transferase WcaK-like protein
MKTILLRSSWQTVNIGDIAHTPGMLRLIEQYLPGTSVILWPTKLDRGVEAMLRRRFPKLRLISDSPNWKPVLPQPNDPTLAQAMEEASFWLTGSGSGVNAPSDLQLWRKTTKKPYGILGASVGVVIGQRDYNLNPEFSPEFRDLLDNATFLFTRETTSLGVVRRANIKCPRMDFVPDATFALDLRDDKAAQGLMREHGLEADKFICAIPRLRVTPYWDMPEGSKLSPEEIARRQAINEKYKEADCAKMREAITTWVRQTGNKVLLCPEVTYQMSLFKLVMDPLPSDVKSRVVAMNRFWITDEAASVYKASRLILSMDCHSPIIANAVGRPGFYLRQPEDTWKGQMYPDLGLGDWKFEIEETTGAQISDRLMQVHTHYNEARDTVRRASKNATQRYQMAMDQIKKAMA